MAGVPEETGDESVNHWKPPEERGDEDELLIQYGKAVGGRLIAEAPIAGAGDAQPWPEGSSRSRIPRMACPHYWCHSV